MVHERTGWEQIWSPANTHGSDAYLDGLCKGCEFLWSYYCIISLAMFTYGLRAATYAPLSALFPS
ncbi:hypothetical protein ARMSODRAFT_967342 [Armillaria solidipes]|uniref:Uncharacterized protein n=1 Tax=Armillaria solidipes TaxID=1076256 RepID=A0A2H3AIZ9_9AGAR|nr:hypothetical protein ARMSODRAFT_967342 [Armillaria solidipes]